MRYGFLAAALVASAGTGAPAAILYQQTVTAANGVAYFDATIELAQVVARGSVWLGGEGGTIDTLDYSVFGDFEKLWWEDIGPDENDQPIPNLTGNNYIYFNGCLVSPGSPSCGSDASLRSRLQNNTVRIDFVPPRSFNRCYPFDGVFNVDCAAFFNLAGAQFSLGALGTGDVTVTLYDSRIAGAIPEPAAWTLMIAGFAAAGTMLRRRRIVSPA